MVRGSRLLAATALLMAVCGTATAQRYSKSYEFLEAVRKADGAKVTDILQEPGTSIINAKNDQGEGALHIVAKRSDVTYLRFLLQSDANPNIQDAGGNTPMIVCVNQSFIDGIEALVRYKANVNLANSSGETPLIRAVQLRNLEMVRVLLAAGADPDKADVIAGMSARDYARRETRMPLLVKMLEDAPRTRGAAVSGPKL